MTELLHIQSEPATLSVNFAEVRAVLEKRVAEYDIVVTADSVADAKKLATELNKQRAEIEAKRKAAVAEVSEPIKAFDAQMKELSGLYEEGRQKILVQVQRFEDETRELARQLLEDEREAHWHGLEVDAEFRRAEYDDLIKLTAVTKTGKLSAGTYNALRQRTNADRALQDRTRMRLMELENRSYKAGLKAPLTRDHVEHFLFFDDDQYRTHLERILTAEMVRQDEVERQERERAAKERRQEDERQAQKAAEDTQRSPATEPPVPEQAQSVAEGAGVEKSGTGARPPEPAADGKVAWSVHCIFRIECSPRVTQSQIEQQLRTVMAQAGISTLNSVEAIRQSEQEAA